MISKNVIIATREEFEKMCKLAHCDGQNGFDCNIKDYLIVIE